MELAVAIMMMTDNQAKGVKAYWGMVMISVSFDFNGVMIK